MKAARGRVTLSDSSDTFSGMWRIRSKLRSRASFFSIRRARSARAELTETRWPSPGEEGAGPGQSRCGERWGAVARLAPVRCGWWLRPRASSAWQGFPDYSECAQLPTRYSLRRSLSGVMPSFTTLDVVPWPGGGAHRRHVRKDGFVRPRNLVYQVGPRRGASTFRYSDSDSRWCRVHEKLERS